VRWLPALPSALSLLFLVPTARDTAATLRWDPPGLDYPEWSEQIARRVPPNARVLLAVTPDPYFALVKRADLTLHALLPGQIPFSDEQARALLADTDVIVVGRYVPAPWLLDALKARGRSLFTVGKPGDVCYGRVVVLARE
jgi:hypothetical protein